MEENCFTSVFYPKSVAIFGASDEKGKIGNVCMKNLVDAFKGPIYPIHPSKTEIMGRKAYSKIGDVPEKVDLALICVPAEKVPSIIEEGGQNGLKAAVVITSGFAEAGSQGKILQENLVRKAKDGEVRVIGPNCFGIYNCNFGLNASIAVGIPQAGGKISFITHSGAYGMAIYTFAMDHGLRFAKIASLGNKCDIQDYELIKYLGEDAETRVICLFLESLDEGWRFFREAKKITPTKPIVATKTGRSRDAARAAASHTAAIAGDFTAYETAFKQSGVIFTRHGLEMVDAAKALDWQPLPAGGRVGIVTNSGGTAIELTDLCSDYGLTVPELLPEFQERIRQIIPSFASAKNPVDMTPIWPKFAEIYPRVIEAFFESPNIDIIMPILLQRSAMMKEVVEQVRDAILRCQQEKKIAKPVYVCWVSGRDVVPNMDILQSAGIPCYEWPERTARVAGLTYGYQKYRQQRQAFTISDEGEGVQIPANAYDAASKIFKDVRAQGRSSLLEHEAKRVISAYGIDVIREIFCATKEESLKAAKEIGFPVALKIVSPQILHKTEAKGVRLNIASEESLSQAYDEIMHAARTRFPQADIRGVLIQEMADGIEVIFGAVRDQQFGPMLMFGLGGIFVEVFKDVSYRICPLEFSDARLMIQEIKGYSILQGARGKQGVNVPLIESTIMRLSNFLEDFPEIVEMDLNPTLVSKERAVVADARMILRPGKSEK